MSKIKGGYVLQPRTFDNSEASRMPPVVRETWFLLLRKANHKDIGKFKRGSCFMSIKDIQDSLCWYAGYRKMVYSKPQISKALRKLSERNMVATTKETRGMTITICNYDIYQNPENYEGNTKETRKKSSGHTKNKNDKEWNNEIKIPEGICVDSWLAFFEMRIQKKKPMTEKAINMMFNKLLKLAKSGHSTQLLLEKSTLNGWTDVYPDKDTNNGWA